uniref:NADH-ubiquinone oxidoreductase chain 5 n=1 Tax=Pelomedusa subrufa TaxID=44522 RepID=NU5M_PELSU|nr:NADH dehydrogenase subunit 5 [Pelomedusa subrufa]O79678.1 RecName: Full=NADH-ubiquinone oxidoreductase chain 5; AltName: Full=NADH dehydrogenase subunit 5 [Pelomedusa subrufa]AAD05058.1 NADH dehydrogenase subunit 5 [Pelomedusa subrufa]
MPNLQLILKTILITELLILALSALMTMLPPILNKLTWDPEKAMTTTFRLSLTSILIHILIEEPSSISSLYSPTMLNLAMSIKIDYYSLIFISIALFITRAILQYTKWYMASDRDLKKFSMFLLLFLMSMIMFIAANNFFPMLVGWGTMGLMSYLLISWWHGRTEATTSGLQAILYNRLADIGFILTFSWCITYMSSLDLNTFFATSTLVTGVPILGMLMAAMGKSAQFGMHPWLPAAMEGPTPVSALLHSSTMVTAGVYLLIGMHPILSQTQGFSEACLTMGAATALYASFKALLQNDLKKIIAFSTLSQLGFMMATVGLNHPNLAFMHLCMHAFFKAMMFLCAGSISHALFGEQDIRKMSGMIKVTPITASCFTLSTLALAGFPFLTGFFSKDLIIETILLSKINMLWATMLLISTMFTAIYSLRMTLRILTGTPWYNDLLTYEENPTCTKPIMKLALASIVTGSLFSLFTPPIYTPLQTMPPTIKLAALTLTFMSAFLAMYLISLANNKPLPKNTIQNHMLQTAKDLKIITHRHLMAKLLKASQKTALQILDNHWKLKAGPKYIEKTQIPMSMKTSTQSGLIKTYFMAFLVTFVIILYIMLFY